MRRNQQRPALRSAAMTTAVSATLGAATVADDLPEPYAALTLIAITAAACTALGSMLRRINRAHCDLDREQAARTHIQGEYDDLVRDYNTLILDQAETPTPHKRTGHGPQCQCSRHRGPYLTLIDQERRHGSA